MSQEKSNVVTLHPIPDHVRAASRGDRSAANDLLLELLPRVRNLVRYLVFKDEQVDDITQDALLAILRGLPTYAGRGPFKAWVDRVVARSTFAVLRRKQLEIPDGGEAAALARSCASDPYDTFAARRDTVRALDCLPPEQRHVLVLHHALGYTVLEVAEELDIPEGTVRSRLRLGKLRLEELRGKGKVAP